MANKAGALHTVAGSTDTRRSPRVYTHAVVGEFDRAQARAIIVKQASWQAKDTWEYNAKVAQAEPGVPVRFVRPGHRDIVLTYDAQDIEKALKFMDSHPALDAYLVFWIEEMCAKCVTAADGELHVLQWSMSWKNAMKGAKSYKSDRYRNVRVVPVERS